MRRILEVDPLLFSRGGEMRILSFITVARVIDRIPRHFENEAAVVIAFEIVVEAAKHISEDFRLKHSEVPWRDMAGMRDKLTHDNFGVDLAVLWKTVQQDVPMLGRPKKPSLWGRKTICEVQPTRRAAADKIAQALRCCSWERSKPLHRGIQLLIVSEIDRVADSIAHHHYSHVFNSRDRL